MALDAELNADTVRRGIRLYREPSCTLRFETGGQAGGAIAQIECRGDPAGNRDILVALPNFEPVLLKRDDSRAGNALRIPIERLLLTEPVTVSYRVGNIAGAYAVDGGAWRDIVNNRIRIRVTGSAGTVDYCQFSPPVTLGDFLVPTRAIAGRAIVPCTDAGQVPVSAPGSADTVPAPTASSQPPPVPTPTARKATQGAGERQLLIIATAVGFAERGIDGDIVSRLARFLKEQHKSGRLGGLTVVAIRDDRGTETVWDGASMANESAGVAGERIDTALKSFGRFRARSLRPFDDLNTVDYNYKDLGFTRVLYLVDDSGEDFAGAEKDALRKWIYGGVVVQVVALNSCDSWARQSPALTCVKLTGASAAPLSDALQRLAGR